MGWCLRSLAGPRDDRVTREHGERHRPFRSCDPSTGLRASGIRCPGEGGGDGSKVLGVGFGVEDGLEDGLGGGVGVQGGGLYLLDEIGEVLVGGDD